MTIECPLTNWNVAMQPSLHEFASSRHRRELMARCDTCGNDYDKAFQVILPDRTGTFDSFECAIQALAPTCTHCDCRILGHGVEKDEILYCCAHCAGESGVDDLRDRA